MTGNACSRSENARHNRPGPGHTKPGLRRSASAEPGAPPTGDVGYFVSAIRFASAAWTKRGFSLVASASDASAFDRYPACLYAIARW